MAARISFLNLPVEIVQVIFEQTIDGEQLDSLDLSPSRSLQILLACIHTSSDLRSMSLSYRPVWRKVATCIPSKLLAKCGSELLHLCSERSNYALSKVVLGLGKVKNSPELWHEVVKSAEALLPSASSLRKLHLPVAVDEDFTNTTTQRIEGARSIAISALWTLLRHTNPPEGLEYIRARLEDLIKLTSLSPQVSISPRALCLVLYSRISDPSNGFWNVLCHRLEHLCVLTLPDKVPLGANRSDLGSFLDPSLRSAASTLTCLEVHTWTSSDSFRNIAELSVLSKLRINLLGPRGRHRWTARSVRCPSLVFLDVPISFLQRISAPSVTHAALKLKDPHDSNRAINAFDHWPNLERLSLYIVQVSKSETGVVERHLQKILLGLMPSQINPLPCPALERLTVTCEPPRWYCTPYNHSLANYSMSDWWSDVARGERSAWDTLPNTGYELIQLLDQRRGLSEWQALPMSISPVRKCSWLEDVVLVGWESPPTCGRRPLANLVE